VLAAGRDGETGWRGGVRHWRLTTTRGRRRWRQAAPGCSPRGQRAGPRPRAGRGRDHHGH
jgi:hypothetical protein